MTNSVIIYGPPESGKTRIASDIQAHFGLKFLQDGWDGVSAVKPDTLVITNLGSLEFSAPLNVCRVLSVDRARALLGAK